MLHTVLTVVPKNTRLRTPDLFSAVVVCSSSEIGEIGVVATPGRLKELVADTVPAWTTWTVERQQLRADAELHEHVLLLQGVRPRHVDPRRRAAYVRTLDVLVADKVSGA